MVPALPFSLCFLDCVHFGHLVVPLFVLQIDGAIWESILRNPPRGILVEWTSMLQILHHEPPSVSGNLL